MKVLKFGGGSLRDGAGIAAAAGIIRASGEPVVAVFSSLRGVTELLTTAAREAERGEPNERLQEIARIHKRAASDLLGTAGVSAMDVRLRAIMAELGDILTGIALVGECSPRTLDLVQSFGERLACTLAEGRLVLDRVRATYLDARQLIRTDSNHGNAVVDLHTSYDLIREALAKVPGVLPVIPGGIASSGEGATTTLGRNGSDYTASIVAAGLGATGIELWTDVDGIMSADPRFVESAFVISELGYHEAMELSYFGARVIHPSAMIPAVDRNIPIRILNSAHPDARGTIVSSAAPARRRAITGIASIENVAIINIEGGGMVGIPGIAARVLSALAAVRVNVIMISQASSEHSICIACGSEDAWAAVEALRAELRRELLAGLIVAPQTLNGLEVIAIVGENMRGTPGISGRLFSALGAAGVNVLAIAQGSSERNISLVVESRSKREALNAIHRAFLEEQT